LSCDSGSFVQLDRIILNVSLEQHRAELRQEPKLPEPILRAGRKLAREMAAFIAVAAFSLGLTVGCSHPMPGQSPSTPLRDINARAR
jgi:hypothetical protein